MKKGKIILGLLAAAGVVSLSALCFSAGMLIPKDQSLPPLGIEYLRVKAEITEGAAETHVEQAFRNSTNRALEATYVFPMPEGAAIKEFAMYIGGKRVTAELLDAGKAKKIYQDIVRRAKDPALLEYIGGKIFRVSVFPVPANGLQKIELDYSQTVEFDSGLRRYVFPLRIGEKFSKTLKDFSATARISSNVSIGSIYSPSHVISTSRKGDNEATVGCEEESGKLDRDFVLYYALSKKEFGLSMMSHRAGSDGFFMLMISPRNVVEESQIVKKDICFVMDTSGSMSGEKIKQTKAALVFCLDSLNKGDRFNIVRFSTDVDSFEEELTEVNDEAIEEAKGFVEKMAARGGTDIASALEKALSAKTTEGRPYLIVFLTDGKPTVGITDEKQIIGSVAEKNEGDVRLFVFGAGYNVNTRLLDTLASENKGVAEYVEPKEDIELKVSSFYAKASNPVLAAPKLSFGEKVHAFEIYPKELPDLFKGSQVLVLGKYSGEGDVAVTLSGRVNEEKRSFVYETTFPEQNEKNDFVERLWATRKVGYLLEQIRLHGEEKELKEEVMRLSKEYGIVTPYTSYLIVEDEGASRGVRRGELSRDGRVPAVSGRTLLRNDGFGAGAGFTPSRERGALRSGSASGESLAEGERDEATALRVVPILGGTATGPVTEAGRRKAGDYATAADTLAVKEAGGKPEDTIRLHYMGEGLSEDFSRIDGDVGVVMSKAVRDMKEANLDVAGKKMFALKNVNKRNFYQIRGVWVDSEFTEKMSAVNIKFGSEAYFRLLELKPELKSILALGDRLIVTVDGKAIYIAEDVQDPVSAEEVEEILKEA